MRRFTKIGVVAAVVGASVVGLQPTPASAGVVVVASGTELNITMTGNVALLFSCTGGKVYVSGLITSPAINCSTLAKVTANGDASPQDVHGDGLSLAPFAAHPYLSINTGGGADTVRETLQADLIDTGEGNDRLVLFAGGQANTTLITGPDLDHIDVEGTAASETFQASSANQSVSIGMPGPSTQAFQTVIGAEWLEVYGRAGNDIINIAGVGAASSIDVTEVYGHEGNDTITSGPVTTLSTMVGGPGTNLMIGSDGSDDFTTDSDTDDISPGKGVNHIYDHRSLRSGGRTLHTVSGGISLWDLLSANADAVVRVREGAVSSAVITASLNRTGQQVGLTNSITNLDVRLDDEESDTEPNTLGLADVVTLPLQKTVHVYGEGDNPKDLADVTVSTGAWTTTGTLGQTYTIHPATSASVLPGTVTIHGISTVSVHASWANLDQGWAHRVIRDLLFRFPGGTERDAIRDQVASGTKTRAQVVAGLMATDDYRGLDVDRVFIKFLRRTADPSGRNYWIGSLGNGKPLIKFRAQLFGSNEYFTKAGGTNAQYMVKAYNDVLGRAPDPSGQAYWTNKLNNGAERGAVALQFLASTEARRNIVKDQFLRFIDRYPTTDEASYWVGKLAGPTGEQDLIAGLAAGGTYHARS